MEEIRATFETYVNCEICNVGRISSSGNIADRFIKLANFNVRSSMLDDGKLRVSVGHWVIRRVMQEELLDGKFVGRNANDRDCGTKE